MGDLFSLAAVFVMLFFLGMSILRVGLYHLSYNKIKYILTTMTKNHYTGIITGFVATAFLQSSSLVLVLTIGFVSVGMLSFKQTLGIILGANIGTTITGELMAFSNIIPEWSFVVIGAFLIFINNRFIFGIGAIFVGLGSIFVALQGFESLAESINQLPIVQESLAISDHFALFGILVGTLVSAVIQSSSATIAITMSFLHEGIIELKASIAIVLGANIGTCITALLAIIGLKKEEKLVAMSHVWFNVLGVLLFMPFLGWLTDLASLLATDAKQQLAHISVVFNLLTVVCMLPFIGMFEKFIVRMHGSKQ
ncbi:Na/Pi symporter [Radiobacillus sp. PE A8.2]|uniref:Na/Pi symporter n=1 Tax=Radiobacillus sp. PE A8.2 TaxID=3380349 RepID=UPI00388F23BB